MTAVYSLNTALSGLKVAQSQISVASNNIANVSTEGYTRKTLEQYTTVIGGEGAGVNVGNIQHRIDDILLRDYRTQVSKSSNLDTTRTYLNQLQDFVGTPDSEGSLTSYIGGLKDAFSQLSDQPENQTLLNSVFNKAQQVVDQFSAYSQKLTQMRNDAQTEMAQSVDKINALTKQIAELNVTIKVSTSLSQSTAELEDKRDIVIKDLAKEMDISYFKTDRNVLVIMTRSGQELVSTQATPVTFNPSALGTSTYYPASAGAVILGENATVGVDLTATDNVGGRLGALIELRDNTLPTYQAELDEAAHKMATRFDAEGLALFTNPNGTIPANTPASYVGFANDMVINPAIVQDKTLIRTGTDGLTSVQEGSSEVLRKIVEFTFGSVAYQQGVGTQDISNTVPTLYTTLGMTGTSRNVGTANIQALGALDSSTFINPGTEDTFTLAVGAGAPQTITITAGMTATGLVTAINTAFPGMAQLGAGGQLVLTANNDLTIGAGTLGASGLNELGFTAGLKAATSPSFQVRVGRDDYTTIQISSTDTTTNLLAKLNAVPGLTASLTTDGFLKIVPTNGGDISIIDGTGTPVSKLGITVSDVKHTAFNTTNLGPGSNLKTEVLSAVSLQNFLSQSLSLQSQTAANTDSAFTTEDSYRATIAQEYQDGTGVNLDEEMARLISIQTAYSASARTIKAVQDMLTELMNTFG